MRGQVFNIDGRSFFTMGGGASSDKICRKEGSSWWPREMPSGEEYTEALENLGRKNFTVDYIVTHTASLSIMKRWRFCEAEEKLNLFFEDIDRKTKYIKWFFGHAHKDINVDDRHVMLYNRVVPLESL
jgi:hypothetical protein